MKIRRGNLRMVLGAAALGAMLILRSPILSAPPPALAAPAAASLGTLSGRVTRDDGSPAAGCSVVVRSTRYVTPAPSGEAVTDAQGRYSLRLDTAFSPRLFQSVPPAPADTQFTVTVEGQEPLYLFPPERTVTFPPNLILQDVNFRLTTGPLVTVRMHDALTGQPIPGITAQYNIGFSNDPQTAGVTDAQGKISFRVPNLEFQLSLVPPGGNTPTVKAASGYNFYRQVRMPQIEDVVWDVHTESTTPPTMPTAWRGTVLTPEGRPAAGAKVSVLCSDAETATVTDKKGRFTASISPRTFGQYGSPYRGAAILAQKDDQSATVLATYEATQEGMNVRLTRKPLASYAGTVVGPDGSPEAGVRVSCRGGLDVAPDTGVGITRAGVTDAQGRFRLAGLPAGHYQVNLGGGIFGPVTLPPSDPEYPYSKTLLTLEDGETHDLGRLTVPPADEVVAGQIVDHDGKPVTSRIIAIVHGAHTNHMASLDDQGRFRVYHVVREALTLDLYHADDGGASTGQTSHDLFLKAPLQAGRQDARVVFSADMLPPLPPPAAPVPVPAPVGPPRIAASFGTQMVAGLWMTYEPENYSADPKQGVVQVTLGKSFGMSSGDGLVWKGRMADMDGMQLVARKNHGVLTDRSGQMLWTGEMQPTAEPVAYQIITDKAKPNTVTLQDRRGRTLWSGAVLPKIAPVQFLDGYVAVIGTNGRIAWQQPAVSGNFSYRTLERGQAVGDSGFHPSPFEGEVHFAAAPRQVVFKMQDGHVLYSGSLLTLTMDVKRKRKMRDPRDFFFDGTSVIFPFSVSNVSGDFACTVFDAQGKTIQTITIGRPSDAKS